MKLLFDQNISFRIIKPIEPLFPGSIHVSSVGLTNASDLTIWEFAKGHRYSVVTFDADFISFSTLLGHPPKLIHLAVGNKPTARVYDLLYSNYQTIEEFINNQPEVSCLVIK